MRPRTLPIHSVTRTFTLEQQTHQRLAELAAQNHVSAQELVSKFLDALASSTTNWQHYADRPDLFRLYAQSGHGDLLPIETVMGLRKFSDVQQEVNSTTAN